MPKDCHECDTTMLPADDLACEKAHFVCPECAPDFVLANTTSFTNVEDPLPDPKGGVNYKKPEIEEL